MTTERRKSPRRPVERIERTGGWGKVRYHHHLACGHIEIRPRASKAPKLACAWCLRTSERDAELRNPAGIPATSRQALDLVDDLGQNEVNIEQTRAALAKTLSVPADAVDIVAVDGDGGLTVQSALVFLSAQDVDRLVSDKLTN